MNQSRDTLKAFTDAAADVIGREIAALRREATRERELRDAEYRARLAEIDAAIASTRETERRLAERLATLKDGEPGRDGRDGVDGTPGAAGKDGAPGADGAPGRDGIDGKDAQPVTIEMAAEALRSMLPGMLDQALADYARANPPPAGPPGPQGAAGPVGPQGERGEKGDPGDPGPAGPRGDPGEAGPQGAAGERGSDGMPGRDGRDGMPGRDGAAGKDGEPGAPGRDGIDGLPGKDGERGRDGRSPVIRGTWSETESYGALDVVALDGGAFIARRDDPGPCPGEGWQMIACRGKPGKPGERGGPGPKGDRGPAGEPVVALTVDDQGMFTLTNGDGSEVSCDAYPILSKLR